MTALGLAGHRVGVCDPSPLCLGRFSRFVTKWHQCPRAGKDPSAYFECVLSILDRGAYEVLFPAHEQAFLFSRWRHRIPPGVALAIADFQSFLQIQGKAALGKTLGQLSIPQPESHLIQTEEELKKERCFPLYLNFHALFTKDLREFRYLRLMRASVSSTRTS